MLLLGDGSRRAEPGWDDRRRDALACATLIAWVFFVYRESFAVYFINEDFTWLLHCRFSRHGLWPLLTRDVMGGIYSWRPVVQLSMAANYAASGVDPFGYRLTALAWHALAACLLYRIGTTVSDPIRGMLAATLFATHPLQVESLSWTCARGGPISTALLLLAVLGYLRWRQQRAALLWVAVPFALALATQESAIIFPALILAAELLLPEPHLSRGRRGRLYATLGAVIVGFLLLRRAMSPAAFDFGMVGLDARWPVTVGGLLTFLIGKLQRAAALLLTLDPATTRLALPLTAAVALAALWCWWRGRLLALWGFIWVGIALAPYSLLLLGPVARYMHLPLAGFGLVFAELLLSAGALLAHWQRRVAVVVVALLTALWLGHMVRAVTVQEQAFVERGRLCRQIITDMLRLVPAPPAESRLAFYGIGELRARRGVFTYGLEDAVRLFYRDDTLRVVFRPLPPRGDAAYHLWYDNGRLRLLDPESR